MPTQRKSSNLNPEDNSTSPVPKRRTKTRKSPNSSITSAPKLPNTNLAVVSSPKSSTKRKRTNSASNSRKKGSNLNRKSNEKDATRTANKPNIHQDLVYSSMLNLSSKKTSITKEKKKKYGDYSSLNVYTSKAEKSLPNKLLTTHHSDPSEMDDDSCNDGSMSPSKSIPTMKKANSVDNATALEIIKPIDISENNSSANSDDDEDFHSTVSENSETLQTFKHTDNIELRNIIPSFSNANQCSVENEKAFNDSSSLENKEISTNENDKKSTISFEEVEYQEKPSLDHLYNTEIEYSERLTKKEARKEMSPSNVKQTTSKQSTSDKIEYVDNVHDTSDEIEDVDNEHSPESEEEKNCHEDNINQLRSAKANTFKKKKQSPLPQDTNISRYSFSELPSEFSPEDCPEVDEVFGFDSTEPKLIEYLSYLAFLRRKVYDRKVNLTQGKSYEKGYRFPLIKFLGENDRPELKFIAKKFYKEGDRRVTNTWLYYFPSTSDLKHSLCSDFFNDAFPNEGELEHINAVHEHHNTECFCIALHDSIFQRTDTERLDVSKVVCMISFRLLKDVNESGVYIYYLGTIHGQTFNEVMPKSRCFDKLRCPVEGQGMGEFLLRLTQLFATCIRRSCNVFLAVNNTSTYIGFYEELGFNAVEMDDVELGKEKEEVIQCALLESTNLEVFRFMVCKSELKARELDARRMILRHCKHLSRDNNKLPNYASERYCTVMDTVVADFADEPYKADKDRENSCFLETNEMLAKFPLPDDAKYVSNGVYWKKYHKMWSEDNFLSYWDVKSKFKVAIQKDQQKRNARRDFKVLSLEEQLMDYAVIGRVITDNECSNNTQFNLHCSFCLSAMTEKPLSKDEFHFFSTMIAQAHFLGNESNVLAIASEEMFGIFQHNVKSKKLFKIKPCFGFNYRANYEKIFKACLQDYLVPKNDWQSVQNQTHSIYNSLYEAYANNYRRFFKRALKGSAESLLVFHNSGEFDYPDDFWSFLNKNVTKSIDSATKEQNMINEMKGKSGKKKSKSKVKRKKKQKKHPTCDDRLLKKEERFSDKEIKTNWVTLMKYNPVTWDPSVTKPHCARNVKLAKKDFFYIGRSDIRNNQVYFFVSENMIPDMEEKQPIFTKKFLQNLPENEEMEIEETARMKLLRAVRLFNGMAIEAIIPQKTVNNVKTFHGLQNNGHWDKTIDHEWVEFNFKYRFPDFYKELMLKKNIGKECTIPSGAIEFEESDNDKEEDNVVPRKFRGEKEVCFKFENKACCAFGNMANALSLFGDEAASDFFFDNKDNNIQEMKAAYTKSGTEGRLNGFHLAREIVRQKFRYQVRYQKHSDLIELANENRTKLLYVQLHAVSCAFTHVIVILDNQIIDGTFPCTILLSSESVQWLIQDEHYNFIAYSVEMSMKIKKAIMKQAKRSV